MIHITAKVNGMHCASCAAVIEKTLKKSHGVHSVSVQYATETAQLNFDNQIVNITTLSKQIEPFGYSLTIPSENIESAVTLSPTTDKQAYIITLKRQLLFLLPLAVISIIVMGWEVLTQFTTLPKFNPVMKEFIHHLFPIFATYTLFVVGQPYLLGIYRFIRYRKANMDSLIGIGTLAAFLYSFIITAFEDSLRPFLNVDHTYYDVTIVVITFITLGKYLEAVAKLKTGAAVEKLLHLQAKTAVVLRAEKEVEVPIESVIHGDIVIIKPGGRIPVDGVVVTGSSYVDEAMITGEPMPVEKRAEAVVTAGTINTTGTFTIRATKIGAETMLAHIITMVQQAQNSKAPIQGLTDKISAIFVPVVAIIAIITLALWLIIGGYYVGFAQALSYGLVSFVSILIIACPCALGLATPTAIIVGVGRAASLGILIKDATALETLHRATVMVVDKTGTITQGHPTISHIEVLDSTFTERDIISILVSLEVQSEHPLAQAVLTYAREKTILTQPVDDFNSIRGRGITGVINGQRYYVGNSIFLKEMKVPNEVNIKHTGTMLLAHEKGIIGSVDVTDSLRPLAAKAIQTLHQRGIRVIMMTGDTMKTARTIAEQVGIDEVIAEVMPADKLNKVIELQTQGAIVAMTGDGVNDAPALAQADIGIAMATGTDVAVEAADIVLLHGDITKLIKAFTVSKFTMRGIKQNLFWAFAYNIIGIPVAAGIFYPIFGWLLNPVLAAVAMAFSSVSVVLNSLSLKTKKI